MKKIIALVLVVLCLQTSVFASSFSGDFLDPFNNELFQIVAETDFKRDFHLSFDFYDMIYSDDYTSAKAIHTIIDYDGTVTTTDLCDFTDSETASTFLPENWLAGERLTGFNDGLAYCGMEDGCYLGGLKDVTGSVKYMNATESYFTFEYNMGLLMERENDGWMGKSEDYEYKTTITEIMSSGKVYEFNCDITEFNNDGYALMDADGKVYVIKLKKGIIPTVAYDGEKILFDQIPVIENGRTLVPLRAIFEKIGAEVAWDDATQTVTASKDDVKISLTLNDTTALKNSEKIELDVPAKIVNGRTLVPVRFVADCFGADVNWDDTMQRVIISSEPVAD